MDQYIYIFHFCIPYPHGSHCHQWSEDQLASSVDRDERRALIDADTQLLGRLPVDEREACPRIYNEILPHPTVEEDLCQQQFMSS